MDNIVDGNEGDQKKKKESRSGDSGKSSLMGINFIRPKKYGQSLLSIFIRAVPLVLEGQGQ